MVEQRFGRGAAKPYQDRIWGHGTDNDLSHQRDVNRLTLALLTAETPEQLFRLQRSK